METITKSEWKALHKDYKEIINGQRYILKWTAQGTTLVPVKIIADKEAKKFKAVYQFEGTQGIKYYKDQFCNWYGVIDNEINYCCNWKNGTPPDEKLEFDKEVFDVELIENLKTRGQKNNG